MSYPQIDNDGYRYYGQWAGNEKGNREDRRRCIEQVWPTGRSILPAQCSRLRGYGQVGLFCKQHAKKYKKD